MENKANIARSSGSYLAYNYNTQETDAGGLLLVQVSLSGTAVLLVE